MSGPPPSPQTERLSDRPTPWLCSLWHVTHVYRGRGHGVQTQGASTWNWTRTKRHRRRGTSVGARRQGHGRRSTNTGHEDRGTEAGARTDAECGGGGFPVLAAYAQRATVVPSPAVTAASHRHQSSHRSCQRRRARRRYRADTGKNTWCRLPGTKTDDGADTSTQAQIQYTLAQIQYTPAQIQYTLTQMTVGSISTEILKRHRHTLVPHPAIKVDVAGIDQSWVKQST